MYTFIVKVYDAVYPVGVGVLGGVMVRGRSETFSSNIY